MKHGKMTEGKSSGSTASWPKGNGYRAKHDDGSRKSRQKSGGMDSKHHSPTINPGY